MKTMRNPASLLLLTFSFSGLAIVAVLANLYPPLENSVSGGKLGVGAAFIVVCVLGILAGLFPSKCSNLFHLRRVDSEASTSGQVELPRKMVFSGHHPNCGNFGAHVFHVGKWTFCAGCFGLVSGAVISAFCAVMYFFVSMLFCFDCVAVLWIGFAGVTCGLVQYHFFNLGRSSIHTFVNAYFVFGVFLLLVGVDAVTHNILADFYVILLSVFWLYTRIRLSQLDHKETCTTCQSETCKFHMGKAGNSQYLRRIP